MLHQELFSLLINWLSWYCPSILQQSKCVSLARGILESSKQSSFSGLFCELSGTEWWRALGMSKMLCPNHSDLIYTQFTEYRQIHHHQHETSSFSNLYKFRYSHMNIPLDRVENCQVTSICTNLYTYGWKPTISCDLEVSFTISPLEVW